METERGSGEFISAQNDHLLIQFHAVKAFMFHCISMLYNKLMYMHTCSTIPSMASSSTSSVPKSFKYDVFLSFRGEDTRHTFVDHLYNALQQKGICTYKDDEKIEKGKRIIDDLFTSIEESRFYIIVFSKTYASSSWCLEELVKIMECQKMTGHTAYPVFYHVEPTEVRKQSGAFGEAFSKHENKESAGKWREALEDASSLAGWEYMNNGENKFIQEIVDNLSLELRSFNFIVDEKLVGMETRVDEIESFLETSSKNVLMFGIVGMGGAGKTTLARAVYDKISFLFEGKSFVGNVREVSSSLQGLMTLQKQVISDVSKDRSVTVSNVYDGIDQIKRLICCRKVLVVLDDVDRIEQLLTLVGDRNWFKPGSRIIITTRDKQVLIAYRGLFKQVLFGDVTLLSQNESISLLSRHAFGTETPIQGYEGLSRQVVSYASGLPLMIKVLGSKLCGADECIWRDVIEELKEIPLEETQKQLELSYNDLQDQHKEIFLDVACFMKGWRKDRAIGALEACGFHARNGLRVLELKSLITISSQDSVDDNDDGPWLGMHDHIEEMGRNIVRRHGKPHTHSRLWKDKEIEEILAKDLGTGAITGIKLTMKVPSKIDMKVFRKMENLRFLHLVSPWSGEHNIEDEVSQYFPDALRYLFWDGYPFRCLPNTFRPKDLVRLEMNACVSEQLWECGRKEVLDNLKFLVLDGSSFMTLELGATPNLEMLSFEHSGFLFELHVPEKLERLKSLAIHDSSLKSFDLGRTPNLETLDLTQSFDLEEVHIPDECPTLKSLSLGFENIKSIDLRKIANLETLWLKKSDSNIIPRDFRTLSTVDLRRSLNLKELHVCLVDKHRRSNVNNLLTFHMPNEFRELKSLFLQHPTLRTLYLGRTSNQPSSLEGSDGPEDNHMVIECPNLQTLDLRCPKLETLNLQMSPSLETVYICSANLIHTSGWASTLKSLKIIGLEKLETLDLSQAVNLEELELIESLDFVRLHMPVVQLELKSLCIKFSKLSMFDLGPIPRLEHICLRKNLKFPKLKTLHLMGCSMLKTLKLQTPSLESLYLKGCSHVTELVLLGDCPILKVLKLESCRLFEKLPENLGRLECLQVLTLSDCISLQDIPSNIGKMKSLQYLSLRGCTAVEKLPEELGSLEYLKELDIVDTDISHLPLSILLFKDLRIIGSKWLLQSCRFTSQIPTSRYETFYYRGIHSRSLLCRAPPTTRDSPDREIHSHSLLYGAPPTTGDSSHRLSTWIEPIEEEDDEFVSIW